MVLLLAHAHAPKTRRPGCAPVPLCHCIQKRRFGARERGLKRAALDFFGWGRERGLAAWAGGAALPQPKPSLHSTWKGCNIHPLVDGVDPLDPAGEWGGCKLHIRPLFPQPAQAGYVQLALPFRSYFPPRFPPLFPQTWQAAPCA